MMYCTRRPYGGRAVYHSLSVAGRTVQINDFVRTCMQRADPLRGPGLRARHLPKPCTTVHVLVGFLLVRVMYQVVSTMGVLKHPCKYYYAETLTRLGQLTSERNDGARHPTPARCRSSPRQPHHYEPRRRGPQARGAPRSRRAPRFPRPRNFVAQLLQPCSATARRWPCPRLTAGGCIYLRNRSSTRPSLISARPRSCPRSHASS